MAWRKSVVAGPNAGDWKYKAVKSNVDRQSIRRNKRTKSSRHHTKQVFNPEL